MTAHHYINVMESARRTLQCHCQWSKSHPIASLRGSITSSLCAHRPEDVVSMTIFCILAMPLGCSYVSVRIISELGAPGNFYNKKNTCNLSSKLFALIVVIKYILIVQECATLILLKLVVRLRDGSYVRRFSS